MKLYEFDVLLKDLSEADDALADVLFQAGCDDGTLTSRDGRAWVHFDRQAESLEAAIRSAVADVQAAGCTVTKVELEVADAVAMRD